jgi:uncharacterized membrane protein YqjE
MALAAPPGNAGTGAPAQPLRGLFAAAVEALRTRLDLAAVELEIHLRALLRMLIWAVGALACAMLALAFGVTALVVALWDTHRMLALLAGSLVFVALTALFAFLGVRTLRVQPGVLEGSLQQLEEDERRAAGRAGGRP